jgi:hypothetical protein
MDLRWHHGCQFRNEETKEHTMTSNSNDHDVARAEFLAKLWPAIEQLQAIVKPMHDIHDGRIPMQLLTDQELRELDAAASSLQGLHRRESYSRKLQAALEDPARGKRLIELNERLKELRAIEASGKSPDGWWAGVEYDAVSDEFEEVLAGPPSPPRDGGPPF